MASIEPDALLKWLGLVGDLLRRATACILLSRSSSELSESDDVRVAPPSV